MRYAWLCHPVTVAGVVVLLINDHLLKQTWPGFVTGKLSDVAGLLVAPALLALLLPRRADLAATVLTGVVFALVKTTETGADLASQVWTFVGGPSRVLADSSDLLALPALALAWWVRGRGTGPDRRHVMIVTMPLAVLAVTATSAALGHPTTVAVEENDGRITVRTDTSSAWLSEDGGRTWTPTSGAYDGKAPRTAQCVPYQATRCYRVAANRMAVEQSDDGGHTWRPSWAASPDELERLSRQYEPHDRLESVALAVQHRPEGHVVVVANGADGILVRDTSGDWRRVGLPGAEPPEVDLALERDVALFLAACVLFGGVGAGLRRHAGVYTGFAAAACVSVPVIAGDPFDPGGFPAHVAGLGGLPFLAALLALPVSGAVCLGSAIAGRARAVPVAVGTLGAPLVYLSVYTPFQGWAQGTPASHAAATALAVLLTAVVLLAGAALVRNDARRAHLAGTSTSSPT
ncbi:hypothetical protein E1286_11495 [Nonomuraea terrae]|uniref:Uncharacterized protein n=1 Tax=Nonomuraea terrae TaxID=2530383 RepID=A0A4R4YZ41_9ACTN|nr:hypothetical protein [Nonomuraea terrae]TDD50825.1 hypothetical protein E1286_11495 [Nonomuraea terrae]